jgi:hypothetical protein
MKMIKLNKKQKDKIVLILTNLYQDVSYRYGGWIWLFGKLMWNAVMMYVFFGFIQAWYFFVFRNVGIDLDKIKTLRSILWFIGVFWVAIIGFSSVKDRLK